MRRSVLAVLLLSSVALGAPPAIEIPAEVRPAGQYVNFVPKTDAVSVTYVGFSGVEPVPSAALADKKMFLLDTYGKPAGRYKFAAVAAGSTGEQARTDFEVVIGTPPTPPVPPTPPDPKPPDPPTPPPDEATAALTRTFQAAYNADDDTIKETKLSLLTRIMDEAAVQINAKDAKGVYLVTTLKQFADAVHVVTNQQIGSAAIPKLRGSVGVYLNSKLPTVDAPLTEESRAKVAAAYTQVAKSLKGVKP